MVDVPTLAHTGRIRFALPSAHDMSPCFALLSFRWTVCRLCVSRNGSRINKTFFFSNKLMTKAPAHFRNPT